MQVFLVIKLQAWFLMSKNNKLDLNIAFIALKIMNKCMWIKLLLCNYINVSFKIFLPFCACTHHLPPSLYRKCPRTNRINRQKQNNVHFSSENTMRASTRLIWARTCWTYSRVHFRCPPPPVGQPRKLASSPLHSTALSTNMNLNIPGENSGTAKAEIPCASKWWWHHCLLMLLPSHLMNLCPCTLLFLPRVFSEKLNHGVLLRIENVWACVCMRVRVYVRCLMCGRGRLACVCWL